MRIVISAPFAPGTYERVVTSCGGSPHAVFVALGLELSARYFGQLASNPPGEPFLRSLWKRIWDVAHTQTLPEPLRDHEAGEARTLEDGYLFDLAKETLSALPKHRLDDQLRVLCVQIFTALLSPEFRACRQSYDAEQEPEGCARQQVDHCRDRVSGSHCEDCPFFVALSADQHRRLLERSFGAKGRGAVWESAKGIFLPEDFRSLRVFWHLHLRRRGDAS